MYPLTFEKHQAEKLRFLGCEGKANGRGLCYHLRRGRKEAFCTVFEPSAQICWLPACPFAVSRAEHAELRQERLYDEYPVTSA